METQQQLIEDCLAGQQQAFEELYSQHSGMVMAYLLRSGFGSPDAEDLTQETFLRAARSLSSFDSRRGPFAGWLGAVARNVARRHWARRSRGEVFDLEMIEDVVAEPPANTAAELEEIDALRDCVRHLPPQYRRLIELRYVDGLTTRAIAAAASVPEATTRSRLAEAKEMLSRCLRGKGFLQ